MLMTKNYLSLSYVINLSTRKITYSAIFAGVSAIIVIILLTYTPLVTLPTIRISFEGLLIKICGYLFGITVGFFAGILSEALVNLYRPTFFHWAYYLTLISYGVIGGITKHISSVIKTERNQAIVFFSILLILSIGMAIAFQLYIDSNNGFNFLNHNLNKISSMELFYTAQILVILFLPLISLFFKYILPSRKHLFKEILPIYFLAIITGYFVTIPLMPLGDSSSYHKPYEILLLVAIVQTPVNIFCNIFIILIVWKIIDRIIQRSQYARYNTA